MRIDGSKPIQLKKTTKAAPAPKVQNDDRDSHRDSVDTIATANLHVDDDREARHLAILSAPVSGLDPKKQFDLAQHLQAKNTLSYQRLKNQANELLAAQIVEPLKILANKENFDAIDKNKDGISAQEAADYAKGPANIQNPHVASVAQSLANLMTLTKFDTVSLTELQRKQEQAEALQTLTDRNNFDKSDRNGDEILTYEEAYEARTHVDPNSDLAKGLNWLITDKHYEETDKSTGAPDGIIDDFKQANIADCWFLAGVSAVAQTEAGRSIIAKSITESGDGWDVQFAGNPSGKIHVKKEDLSVLDKTGRIVWGPRKTIQYATGDLDIQILGAAADKYFKDEGSRSSVKHEGWPADAMNLIMGKNNTTQETSAPQKGMAYYKNRLIEIAPHIGKNGALVITGQVNQEPGPNYGTVSWNGNRKHVVSVINIDTTKNTITYINPWDSSKTYTTSIDDVAKGMSNPESKAYFHYMGFS